MTEKVLNHKAFTYLANILTLTTISSLVYGYYYNKLTETGLFQFWIMFVLSIIMAFISYAIMNSNKNKKTINNLTKKHNFEINNIKIKHENEISILEDDRNFEISEVTEYFERNVRATEITHKAHISKIEKNIKETCRSNHTSVHRLRDVIFDTHRYHEFYARQYNNSAIEKDVVNITNEMEDKFRRLMKSFASRTISNIKIKLKSYSDYRGINNDFRVFIQVVDPDELMINQKLEHGE